MLDVRTRGLITVATVALGIFSASPAVAAPPADCGPYAGGGSARIVNSSDLTCQDAAAVINEFVADGASQATSNIGPWVCHGFGAGKSESLGYAVRCDSERGSILLAGS